MNSAASTLGGCRGDGGTRLLMIPPAYSKLPRSPMLCYRKAWSKIMPMIHDFVEDWIEMRSKLQRQLKLLESGKMGEETYVIGSKAEATAIRLKKWIDELNDLLKEYGPADRT
jgi:hypothetical protein